jgi:hypothetical protein
MGMSMKPGGGGRFRALAAKLSHKGVRDPDAVAASIGRKKYGEKKMEHWSEEGKKRHGS